jgi:hypothetical protein
VREEARCTSADERKGRKEGWAATDAFYGGSAWRGGGSGVGATWRAGTGKREGAPGVVGIAQAAGIDPRPVGVGGAVVPQQGRAADRQDRATTGPGGQRLGVGGVGGSRVVQQGR